MIDRYEGVVTYNFQPRSATENFAYQSDTAVSRGARLDAQPICIVATSPDNALHIRDRS